MTRPHIVRADTLDLQDQDSPSASTHQKHPAQSGFAPHQRAELSHVLEERHSEEQALSEAWNIADNLVDEPEVIERAQEQTAGGNVTYADGEAAAEEVGESEVDVDDEMMDRISSSPSIDEEEIDFEFVYALHTFVATVEGQANATKGDTMFLLDDSNSYWWLVRLVKDQSIGYLPAEHIETPTERLARLNKHRNIDLSATMLSDNSEKSRNPILKAMRRKTAKAVRFAAPTYVEASDYEFSDEEEDGLTDPYGNSGAEQQAQQEGEQQEQESTAERRVSVEETSRSASPRRRSFDREQAAMAAAALNNDEEPLQSPKLVDKTEAAPLKSRKGTPRNTDSFLKDDSVTIKKTLTPGLLREDSTSTRLASNDIQRTDSLDKEILGPTTPAASSEQQTSKKDGKKEKKERKPGMLSGLFKSKKKDKKPKEDPTEGDAEKASLDVSRDSVRTSPSSFETDSLTRSLSTSTTDTRSQDVQTPPSSRGVLQPQSSESSLSHSEHGKPADRAVHESASSGSGALQNPSSTTIEDQPTPHLVIQPAEQPVVQSHSPISPLAPITNMLKRDDSKSQKPTKAKRSKQRVELDDFDSPTGENNKDPFRDQEEPIEADEMVDEERLSDSPVEIMPGTFMQSSEQLASLTPSVNTHDDDSKTSTHSLSSSPSLIERPEEAPHELEKDAQEAEDSEVTPTAPRSPSNCNVTQIQKPSTKIATSASTAAARNLSTDSATTSSSSILTPISQQLWSDSSLRTWLDDGSEVKDMMVLIHDTSGVEPVPSDHPLMAGLFTEQRKGVENMMSQLDGLLTGYLQKKGFAVN